MHLQETSRCQEGWTVLISFNKILHLLMRRKAHLHIKHPQEKGISQTYEGSKAGDIRRQERRLVPACIQSILMGLCVRSERQIQLRRYLQYLHDVTTQLLECIAADVVIKHKPQPELVIAHRPVFEQARSAKLQLNKRNTECSADRARVCRQREKEKELREMPTPYEILRAVTLQTSDTLFVISMMSELDVKHCGVFNNL